MAPKQRMTQANQQFSKNITQRGNVPKGNKAAQNKLPTSQWLIALFLFVVVGSAVFEIIRYVYQ